MHFQHFLISFVNMEMNARLGTCTTATIGSPRSIRVSPTPSALSPRSPRGHSPPPTRCSLSPTADGYLSNDYSYGASFSGRQLPPHTISPKSGSRNKLGLSLQIGAFYNEGAGGSASAVEDEVSGEERPRSPVTIVRGAPKNFYDVLDVEQDASLKEIRAAYRRKALEFHPDVAPAEEKDNFTEIFAQINEAYTTLSDPHSRSLYDAKPSSSWKRASNPTVPGFNSYSYNFTGFKTDIWARNSGVKSRGVSPLESSPGEPLHPSATSSISTNSISSGWRGRNWETDQCWC